MNTACECDREPEERYGRHVCTVHNPGASCPACTLKTELTWAALREIIAQREKAEGERMSACPQCDQECMQYDAGAEICVDCEWEAEQKADEDAVLAQQAAYED